MSNPPNSINSDDQNPPPPSPTTVNPNFSVITKTIGRQLHNFASFLAPPPHHPYSSSSSHADVLLSSYEGLKNDLDEIGDSLKKAVTGISKFASNLLKGGDPEEIEVVGITDDVVEFVRLVSIRPEWWFDFPLPLQNKDFNLSGVQKDHAFAIQELVPNLATWRHTLQDFMSEEQFWMIYFILLVPRLNEEACRLLLSPEILQMHEALVQKLRNKTESSCASDDATNVTKNKNRKDDVSSSEVEDEEFKQTQSSRVSSASENSDWVRISGTSKANRSAYCGKWSESEESSNDWHAVDDVDL